MSVIVHTKSNCSYCTKAKEFLKDLGVKYRETYYDPENADYEDMKNRLVEKTNHRTFPQIFIGDYFLGGYTELINAHSTLSLHEHLREIGITLDYDF